MLLERSLKISVALGGVPQVAVDVDAASALLGSGAHCDVRVGPEYAAAEHLYLDLQPAGLFGEVRAKHPQVLLDGAPFHGGRIKSQSELRIGALTIQVELVERASQARSKLSSQLNPRTLVGGAMAMGLLAYALHGQLAPAAPEPLLAPPAVFDGAQAQCPETSAEAAAAAAEELLAKADGRRERAPFVPEDAVESVTLYRQVAACLTMADWLEGANIITADADRLQQQTEDAMHLHNVRLQRALELKRGEDAQREVQILRGYVAGRSGAYADWLSKLEREIDLELSRSKNGKS